MRGLLTTTREHSRIAIVGVGGLGCHAAEALVASNVGALTLVDGDRVERSNLGRQVLYADTAIGRPKATVATEVLQRRFPQAAPILAQPERITGNAIADLVAGHDVVIDATDDPATKFALNKECRKRGVSFVYGGATRTRGMAMAVTYSSAACLECAFSPSGSESTDGCARAGVLAPVAGFVGALQAWLALRTLAADASILNRLYVFEGRPRRWAQMKVDRDPDCPACENSAAHAA